MKLQYMCDFETTTDINDCRVWCAAFCEIGNTDNFNYFNNLDDFMEWALTGEKKLFFHNLKFDGEFILSYLLNNDYNYVQKRMLDNNEYTCLISDKGQFYSLKVKNTEIVDSLKLLNFSVAKIAKAFDLPMTKGEIDYNEHRPIGYKPSEKEIDYIKRDVTIVAKALEILQGQGLTKITTGSNALANYKSIISNKTFGYLFPPPEYDNDIRQSYKGGWTYLKEGYESVNIGEGIVLDVNSLYPWVMREKLLPCGEGKFFEGKYKVDAEYPLYIQMMRCAFEIKKNHLPTIQLKNSLAFIPTQYLKTSGDESVTLCLTNVDLQLIKDHYNLYDVEYFSGWKFKGRNNMFKDYIDNWIKIKNNATIDGNEPMRTLAKLMLNSLYGKFGTNPECRRKIPYLENGIVKYRIGEKEHREPIYIPLASFITAYARERTIRTAQHCYDRFVYSDTDSLHLIGKTLPSGIEIDPVKLGAWKHESTFTRAKFIRAKTYIEEIDSKFKITCCGMPDRCYNQVTWENFKLGTKYTGKLMPRHVKGGIVLEDKIFTIQG